MPAGLSARRRRQAIVLTLLGLPMLTAAFVQVRGEVELPTVLLVFLAAVVGIATVGGPATALVAAVAAFLLVNWFLTPPYRTWSIADREHVLALVVFLVVAGVVSLYVSISTRLAGEAATARAEAAALAQGNDLRTAILAAVSHDLRTPLASIKAAVSSLRAEDVDWTEPEERDFLAAIEDETDRLNDLVGHLLDMSRISTGTLELTQRAVGLEEVVAAALASLGDRAPGTEVSVAEDLPRVTADPGLLERTLANLVANAVAWSPPDSPVRISAEVVDERVVLRVADAGPGIPPGERDRVFQPFQRLGDRSRGGVGLGLAVARGFVDAMSGTLAIEETPGGGLTMAVSLPVAAP